MKLTNILFGSATAVHLSSAVSLINRHQVSDAPADTKDRPVTRIINILKQMLDNLEENSQKDNALFKKIKCWADTNRKIKTQEISDGEDKRTSLEAAIEQGKSTNARLEEEIEKLGEDIESKTQALDEATAIRAKQNAEFHDEETELSESIAAIKSAIVVLKRHHGQKTEEEEASKEAAALIQRLINKQSYAGRSASATSIMSRRSKMVTVLTALQTGAPHSEEAAVEREEGRGFWDAPAIGSSNYSPASGEIFGMLNQMSDDFQNDLKEARDLEANRLSEFQSLKASLDKEIAEAINSKESKTAENQQTLDKLAADKVGLRDTNRELQANKDYLAQLEETWKNTNAEHTNRVKLNAEEKKAVLEAIKILSSDQARDLFSSHFNRESKSLLQLRITTGEYRNNVARAISFLQSKGMSVAQLTALSLSKLDAFEKVKEAIDKMIEDLKATSANEIKQRDYCVARFNDNDKNIATETLVKDGHASDIEDIEAHLKGVVENIASLNAEIGEIDVSIKTAGEDRAAQNAEFQEIVHEQVETVKILQKALKVLARVYQKSHPVEEAGSQSFISQPVGPDAPKNFDPYAKQDSGILFQLEAIITKSETNKQEAITAEQRAQADYEKFIQQSNKTRSAKQEGVVNMTGKKGEIEESLVSAESAYDASLRTLSDLVNEQKDLHASCDFVVKNFDITQEARASEIDALKTAKGILSGMK